jgi:hypothetical protein
VAARERSEALEREAEDLLREAGIQEGESDAPGRPLTP